MKLLGQAEAAAFLQGHPTQADRLQAWLSEIRFRRWRNSDALAADFRSADTSASPKVVFHLGRPTLVIETLVDFRKEIVLLTEIRMAVSTPVHIN
jgi:mRNA-degrading endonuclease HigB of HigAB toxin-antitoxin module